MAFTASDLSVLAYANNFTLWHYTTIDSSVTAAGYFNKAVDMLRVNDLIIANVDTDGTPDTTFYVVTGNNGTTVAITAYS
ncbi:MAG: hypothetical protein H6858_01910 [Rhodospirillales bacterium]|nr:hypothetical protein [Alphaproteobacteria bacterium]MCB9976339.1 hypothetical protein [Rhodospirillales bacterium]